MKKYKHVFYVYDVRTQMDDFVASFAVREHAMKYAKDTFGEYGYVSDSKHHCHDSIWNGITEVR